MSASYHLVGIRMPDEKYNVMKAAYEACTAAGVEPPPALQEFFDYEEPDPSGVVVDLPKVREWRDDMREGLEIRLADLPHNLTTLRFYVSY